MERERERERTNEGKEDFGPEGGCCVSRACRWTARSGPCCDLELFIFTLEDIPAFRSLVGLRARRKWEAITKGPASRIEIREK